MKKILSMVLAIVLVLGTCVLPMNAAFTDKAMITKTEAVDVLTALNILSGYEDGSFKPMNVVTRGEMAKMIAVIMNKGEDVGELYKSVCSFADTKTHWAAGYVAYCAQEKIIAGRSADVFAPDDTVTGIEAAKMLLCALGYDPNGAGLVGPSWASNTLSLGRKAENNLFNNINAVMTNGLTREDTAQMMLNALQAVMVAPDGSGTTINLGPIGTITTNVKHTPITRNSTYVLNPTTTAPYAQTLIDVKFETLRKAHTTDPAGRTVDTWTLGGDTVGSYSAPAFKVYNGQVTGGTVFADLGKIDVTNATAINATVYCDGALTETSLTPGSVLNAIKSGSYVTIGAPGSVIEVFYNTTVTPAVLNIAETKYHVGQITSVVAPIRTSAGDLQTAGYVQIGACPLASSAFVNATADVELSTKQHLVGNFFETNDFTMADQVNHTIVAYTLGQVNGQYIITSVAKTTTVVGEVNTYAMENDKVSSITVNRTQYKVGNGFVNTPTLPSSITLYLDPAGNVLASDAVQSGSYAYILAAGEGINEFIGSGMAQYKARILKADGTVEIVPFNGISINGAAPIAPTSAMISNIVNTAVSYSMNTTTGYYTFYTNSKMINLGVGDFTFTGKPSDITGAIINNNTKFVVGTYELNSTTKYSTFTGITAVPGFSTSNVSNMNNNAVSAIVDNAGNAVVVFAPEVILKQAAIANLMAVYKVSSVKTGSAYGVDAMEFDADYPTGVYKTIRAIVDGQVKVVKVDVNAYTSLAADDFTLIMNTTTDKNGVHTSFTPYAGSSTANLYKDTGIHRSLIGTITTWSNYENGIVRIDGEPYAVDAATPVFVFNKETGAVTKTNIATFYTYDYQDNGVFANTFIKGTYTLDSASAAVNTVKVNAFYMVVEK